MQNHACSFGYRRERIIGDMYRKTGLFGDKLVEPVQQRSTSCEDQTAIDQIGR